MNRLELAAAGTDARKARGESFRSSTGCLDHVSGMPPAAAAEDRARHDAAYGEQEERFYHGYYKNMPVLFLAGRQPLMVRLRSAAHARRRAWRPGALAEVLAADAHYRARTRASKIMALCEWTTCWGWAGALAGGRTMQRRGRSANAAGGAAVQAQYRPSGFAAALVGNSGSSPEQGVQAAKDNQRFVVTPAGEVLRRARLLFARGNAENRVKEHKVLSTLLEQPDANTLRVYMATFALLVFRELSGHAAEPPQRVVARVRRRGGWPCRSRRRSPSVCQGMGPAAAGSELASRERGAGCAAGSRPVAPAGRIVPARKKRGAGTARPLPASLVAGRRSGRN